MADRTVKVTLRLLASDYLTGMSKMQKVTEDATRSASEKLAAQQRAMEDLGRTGLTLGAVISAGLALAVGKFAEFDAAMSSVQASTHETSGNMALLRQAALDAGASTVFSATEAANAIEELSKAGVSTRDILGGGLAGALDLASAGELKVADAAQIAATAMTQFNLRGSDVPHIADLLAAGAGKAQGSVQDLSEALKQGGLVASQAGFGIEETTGALAAFASAGLMGSDAGTSLKTAILALQNPSAKAKEVMDEYGISVYDSQGQMRSFSEIAGVLEGNLGGLDDKTRNAALAQIFGNDAVRAANVLYSQGSEGISNWTKSVDDTGYAAETARLKLDNLKGDTEALGGAFDTALIQSGSGANGALRLLVQTATELVTGIGALPAPVLAVGVGLTALVGATALVGGGFLTLVPKIAATKVAMSELNVTGGTLAKGLGKGLGLTAVLTGVVGALTSYGSSTTLAADESARLNSILTSSQFGRLKNEFATAQGGVTDFATALNLLYTDDFWTSYSGGVQQFNGAIKAVTFGMVDLGAFADTNKAKFTQMGDALAKIAETDPGKASAKFSELVELSVKSGKSQKDAIEQVSNAMPQYEAALITLAGAQGANLSNQERYNLLLGKGDLAQQLARDSASRQAETLTELSGVAQEASVDIDALSESITNFGKAQFDVNSTSRAFEAAVDDATAALEKNGATLDIGTEAGRANASALDEIASSALASSAAIVRQTGDQGAASAALQVGRDAYIAAATAAGVSTDAANAYADQLGLVPTNVATAFQATNVPKTQADIDAVQSNLAGVVRDIQINIRAVTDTSQLQAMLTQIRIARSEMTDLNGASSGSGRPGTFAVGGAVYGPGTGTSDSITARLSNGEHVLTALEVMRMGGQAAVYAFRQQIRSGKGAPAFAKGGAVQYMASSPAMRVSVASSGGPSELVGNLYLDSGQLLGVVRGEISAADKSASMTRRAGKQTR